LAKAAKAAEASIKDEASFKTEWPKVVGNCGGCHKEFRAAAK
jgi:cytochrome c556